MFDGLLKYNLGEGVEAFSTQRDAILPYPVIQGHQVHWNQVAVVDRPGMTREELEGYDAFVTNKPGVAIGVRTADCVPILIYDPVKQAIAAVHSGWKGTILHIAQGVIMAMRQEFGTQAENLKVVMGPAIGPDSFQVGEEVAEKFKASGFPMDLVWSFRGPSDGSPISGGHHIDLFKANRWLLEEAGVPTACIQVAGIDSYTDPTFFSARREGITCGRTTSFIKLVK